MTAQLTGSHGLFEGEGRNINDLMTMLERKGGMPWDNGLINGDN